MLYVQTMQRGHLPGAQSFSPFFHVDDLFSAHSVALVNSRSSDVLGFHRVAQDFVVLEAE